MSMSIELATRGPFAYIDDLEARLAAATDEPKTALTRLRLMGAVASVLESEGVHGLRVAPCVARAGVAHGTFYRYWPDGRSAAREVMADFMAAIRRRRPASSRDLALYPRIVAANRYYVQVYSLNRGLMRCLQQLADAEPSFARIGQEANLSLARRVARAWVRSQPEAVAIPESLRLARALACIAMVEGVLREILLRPPPEPLVGMQLTEVADLISHCWHSMLMGRAPPTGGDVPGLFNAAAAGG